MKEENETLPEISTFQAQLSKCLPEPRSENSIHACGYGASIKEARDDLEQSVIALMKLVGFTVEETEK